MLMFIPYLIFGDEIFLFHTDNVRDTLCANQFALAFINTFCFLLYARLKHIYTTRDGFEIIKTSENYMRILVVIAFVSCTVFGIMCFKTETMPYIILCFLHGMAVLACNGVIKRA